tara:strand:+ start:2194 stop:2424 length:231 start_codon:yes stop_codon:yes gene_type:complete
MDEKLELLTIRKKVRGLFSDNLDVKLDAFDALKAAWSFDEPSFRLDELATMDSHAAALAAMRRDSYKEIITWLTKI